MKVFLSHPMHGMSEKEVMDLRRRAKSYLDEFYGEVEIIDNYHHENAPENAGRVWHLGESIKMMNDADLVVFCPGYELARGCRVEEKICLEYDIPYLVLEEHYNVK